MVSYGLAISVLMMVGITFAANKKVAPPCSMELVKSYEKKSAKTSSKR